MSMHECMLVQTWTKSKREVLSIQWTLAGGLLRSSGLCFVSAVIPSWKDMLTSLQSPKVRYWHTGRRKKSWDREIPRELFCAFLPHLLWGICTLLAIRAGSVTIKQTPLWHISVSPGDANTCNVSSFVSTIYFEQLLCRRQDLAPKEYRSIKVTISAVCVLRNWLRKKEQRD